MRIHWGTGIAIVYGIFVVLMVGFVIKSRDIDHSLVMDNYYEEDLAYQSHLNKVANTQGLTADVSIIADATADALTLRFPEQLGHVTGEIWFYRADDTSRDIHMPIVTDRLNAMEVVTKDLVDGKWKVKVDWQSGGIGYYSEQEIYIQ
jgi:hypothetical protein